MYTAMQQDKRYWFKTKRFGWGWMPATKEGWLVTIGYLVLFVVAQLIFMQDVIVRQSTAGIALYAAFVFALTVALIYICWKTGEPPRWRWGK
ncbi:MAG: hypothetical protein JW395_0794 [Nitrospira sp.]|nr:hypothetical protein [Nitrospira sp.]